MNDLRFAGRLLLRSPGFTLVAALTIALGVGANTTIFSLLNALLLHPLPFREPSRLAAVFTHDEKNRGGFVDHFMNSYPNFRDYRERCRSFESMAASAGTPFNVLLGGRPDQVAGEVVTGNYFDLLGVRPALGRFFRPEEDQTPGTHPVAVISHGCWQRRFGGRTNLVGETIQLNRHAYTIIGVTRPEFRSFGLFNVTEVWVPTMMWPRALTGFSLASFENRRALFINVVGRLKPGVTLAQAAAEMQALGAALQQAYPVENENRTVALLPLSQSIMQPDLRRLILRGGALLSAVAALVLLIACANVASLLLARAAQRRREMAIRFALGARRAQVVRQLLTECLLLAALGGGAGILLAVWTRDLVWSFRPPLVPADALDLGLNWRVLGFTAVVTVATGLLCGLAPALEAARTNLIATLKTQGNWLTGVRRRFTVRHALVVGQITLSLIALIGAGLFLRSLQATQSVDPGFGTRNLAVLDVNPGGNGYTPEQGIRFYQDVMQRLVQMPGVEGATFSANRPLNGGIFRTLLVEGAEADPARKGLISFQEIVAPNYFQVTGLPVLRGRGFVSADRGEAPLVAIVNETMAARFWPGQDVLGKRFQIFSRSNWIEVVGVCRDGKYLALGEQAQPAFYQPLEQFYPDAATLVVRTLSRPGALLGSLQREVQGFDRTLPILNPNTIDEILHQSLTAQVLTSWLLSIFAALALVLAGIGLYGLIAYSVSQQTRELGIRMALGAPRQRVLALVMAEGAKLASAGVILGLLAAFGLSRLIQGLLFGIRPTDVTTYAVVAVLLPSIALLASYLPARRAARVDPVVALRYE